MRKSDWQITVILLTRPAQSIKQRTKVAGAHSSFLDVLIVSSPLCVVKSNMAATMWIRFVRNFFYMSLKQQNLFKIQSKWNEFFKSISCILGRIKILMMHFLHFAFVKMHDFCVNAISGLRFLSLTLTVCRCHYKRSTFFSVILRPWVLVRREFQPATSRSADRRSPNWVDQATVNCIDIQLRRERLSEKMCTRQSRKVIWDMINTLFLTLAVFTPEMDYFQSSLPITVDQ